MNSATSVAPTVGDEQCECAFCYEAYGEDDQEWVMCACGKWVHEDCYEDVYQDTEGQEIFCPFCINTVSYV